METVDENAAGTMKVSSSRSSLVTFELGVTERAPGKGGAEPKAEEKEKLRSLSLPPADVAAAPQSSASHKHSIHPSAARSPSMTGTPLGIALLVAWVFALFVTFSFDAVLDVFQEPLNLRDPPVVPVPLVLSTNAGLHIFLFLVVTLLGRLTRRRFHFFQPFVGGDRFIVLQLLGYCAVFLSTVVRAVLLSQQRRRYGSYSVLGVFAVLGHSLLLWSLAFFHSPPSSHGTKSVTSGKVETTTGESVGPSSRPSNVRAWRAQLWDPPRRVVASIGLCCVMVVVSSAFAEYHPPGASVNGAIVVCFVCTSLLTIQYVVVPQWLGRGSYHVFLPVVLKSGTMYVLQLFGNSLSLLTLYGEWLLFTSGQGARTSWHLGCGLMAVTAVCAHLLLVYQLYAWQCEAAERDAAADAEARRGAAAIDGSASSLPVLSTSGGVPVGCTATGEAKVRRAVSTAHSGEVISTLGPVLPSLFSVALYVALSVILYVTVSPQYPLSDYVSQGLTQLEGLLVTLMFVQPILTHIMGVFLYGKAYRVWQPFEGGLDYVFLQGAGWCCYGLSIFFVTLHLSEHRHVTFLLLLMTHLTVSQLLIHMSVVRFGRREVDEKALAGAAAVLLPNKPMEQGLAGVAAAPLSTRSPSKLQSCGTENSQNRENCGEKKHRGDNDTATSGVLSLPAVIAGNPNGFSSDLKSVFAAQKEGDGVLTSADTSMLLLSMLNGELLLAFVLIGVSLIVRMLLVAALYMQHLSTIGQSNVRWVQLPWPVLMGTVTFFSLVATPAVQWSMRNRVRVLHPRSHAYVAAATVGWCTYLLLFCRFLVLWGVGGLERVSHMSPTSRLGLTCFLPSSVNAIWPAMAYADPAVIPAGRFFSDTNELSLTAALECAVEGFAWCFPFLCLLVGDVFETRAVLRAESINARVRKAMKAVTELLHAARVPLANSCQSAKGTPGGQSAQLTALAPAAGEDIVLTQLLRSIAGSRLAASSKVNDGHVSRDAPSPEDSVDPADVRAMHDAARYVTTVLCVATSAAFSSAAFLARAQPVLTVGFGAIGTVTLALSCFSLHYIYGTRVHCGTRPVSSAQGAPRVPVYTFFMPFLGGTRFVAYQAVGWIAFTCVASLMATCVLEGRGAPAVFLIMAGLSVVAQASLRRSIVHFDAEKVLESGFVQRNAEGLLAAIAVAATVSFCRLYEMAAQGRATSHVISSFAPVIICSVSVALAIPLGLLSLQRQAELYGLGSVADWFADHNRGDGDDESEVEVGFEDRHEGSAQAAGVSTSAGFDSRALSYSSRLETPSIDTPTPLQTPQLSHSVDLRTSTESLLSPLLGTPGIVRRRLPAIRRTGSRRRYFGLVLSFLLSCALAIMVVTMLPFALMFMGYSYYVQRTTTAAYDIGIRVVELLLTIFTALVLLPMVIVPIMGRSSTLRNIHSAFCCYALYSIPTYIVVGGISAPLVYNCRGMWLFAINMCSMSVLSTLPYMPVGMLLFTVGAGVLFVQHHLYDGLYRGMHALNAVHCVLDLGFVVFWVWYQRRYHGQPEVTGRFYSRAASRFFQRYFFRGLAYYFSMRVLVGEGHTLPMEAPFIEDAAALPRVDLNNPENQYMFSFHPHGVFPGTSIVAPKTEIWERAVGNSKEHFVSTHCADVVFAVPLMREFPLCLGAMSVSRRGIENSLKQGNSPLIITGGQAEMLLTRMSDLEMHVVCHHIGFIRIAMKHRVPVVPVLSFSESNILDNVHCIPVQRWFLERIAFPFPVLPMGRWKLPLPTAKPVTIVIGRPISPLPGRESPDDPACVEEFRLRYFEHLELLFYQYRAEAGYPQMELYLHNGIYNPGVRGSASCLNATHCKAQGDETVGGSAEVIESAVRRACAMADTKEVRGPPMRMPSTEKKAN